MLNKLNRGVFLLAALAAANNARAQAPWTLIGQGDTQILVLSEEGEQVFINNTQWVADNEVTNNIKFFTQLGDLVTDGKYGRKNLAAPTLNNQQQWQRAEDALSILDGTGVGWGTAVGNHELDWVDVLPGVVPSSSWWSTENPGVPVPPSGFEEWKSRYGPATTNRYADMPQFGGASPNDVDHYFIYTAEGRDYLHFHLQLDIPDDTIAWAQGIIDANPGMPTLISTHIFEGTAHGPPNGVYLAGTGRNSANQVWDKLIKDNSQIFMVLSGHTGQKKNQTRTNTAGKPVFTITQDYAPDDNTDGNPGWMRLYEFDEVSSEIRVKTYSPTRDQYLTSSADQFDLSLDWFSRFDVELLGDLDFNTVVDEQDWMLFRDGHLQDISGLSSEQRYAMGDLDSDGDNDFLDFTLFKTAFNEANGAGQFLAMANGVPEPTTAGMAAVAVCSFLIRRRDRRA